MLAGKPRSLDSRKITDRAEAPGVAEVVETNVQSAGQAERYGSLPLSISTITDRVVPMAVRVVVEPIFEADLQPEQYAYRPGRSALDAIQQVPALMIQGHREVIDADLSGYFDSIT